MPSSGTKKNDVEKAVARYDADLGEVEDRLEADAKHVETSFYKRTASTEAKLERTEDRLEAEARKVDKRGAEREAEAEDASRTRARR
jgi:hypothetical protein